jgi:hypothetical protein
MSIHSHRRHSQMSNAAKPVLDLDTLAPERPTVKIRTKENRRGKHYEIADLEDLSLQDRAELGRLQRTVHDLEPHVERAFNTDADDEVIGQFEDVIDRFLALAIRDLPQDVIAALKLGQKEALLQAFIEASPPEMRTRLEEAMSQTQERQSPASRPSTKAPRKRGSTSARRS